MTDKARAQAYRTAVSQITSVLDGEQNRLAQMSTINCILKDAFPDRYFWTGFYLVDPLNPAELVVGPYQGTLGCLRIAFGRGVCGTAAATGKTQIVDDVTAIANHIACDSRSRSEIVVPVYDETGGLIGVFDVDSTDVGSFDSTDKEALEALMQSVFAEKKG